MDRQKQTQQHRGATTVTTTCGELLSAILEATPNRKAALALLDLESPLQLRLRRRILLVD